MIGETLSHYRITAALGAGGMGEVYRATDTKLGRDVAIKILPIDLASDPERLARFEREAKLLASLNHPNIAAIHHVVEADHTTFLVMELVEGEDLDKRLDRGAIPMDEALEIARQVAEALEEAHGKGIVHRDLKPANVKVAADGTVKVLDFGLAKALKDEGGEGAFSPSISRAPTLAYKDTAAGMILGTAAYMSPEQARGKAIDRRTDVWAFGVLLWEMLTGRTLFAGDTLTDTIAAVVTKDLNLEALPPTTPPAVRRLLERCLRRDVRRRLPDIGAARLEIEDVLAGKDGPTPGATPVIEHGGSSMRERLWAGAFVLAASLAIALALRGASAKPELQGAAHFVIETGNGVSFLGFDVPAVSPDGRRVAFSGVSADGSRRLWVRPLDEPEARPIPGTEGATGPFWSPDGGSLAFTAAGDLRRVALDGGPAQGICALPGRGLLGGAWIGDLIVFSSGRPRPQLYTVASSGGEDPRPLTEPDPSGTAWAWPSPLPDGKHILFDVSSEDGQMAGLYVASLDEPNERRRVLPGSARAVYSSDHLLLAREGVLLAQPFDLDRLEVTGEPAPLVQDVSYWRGGRDWGWFSAASQAPVLAYRAGGGPSRVQLAWRDRDGHDLGLLGEPGLYGQIALSPDGRRVAVEVPDAEGQFDIWVIDVARGVASRLTSDPGDERDPVWSPDSQELIYRADGEDGRGLYRRGLGGGTAVRVPVQAGTGRGGRLAPESWSADGKTLLYHTLGRNAVSALNLGEEGGTETVLELGFQLDEPQLSPRGTWLAYASEESGRWEVYVQPYRGPGERVRVSVDGGGQPKWGGNERELFFLSAEGELMVVDVRPGPSGPEVGLPRALFEAAPFDASLDTYGVSADGQGFLVKTFPDGISRERLHVVTDWPSLLD